MAFEVGDKMKIAAADLRAKGADCSEVKRFEEHWPQGAEINEATLLKAAELSFDLVWFARRFLSGEKLVEFDRQEDPLWDEYQRQITLPWEDFDKVAPLIPECQRAPFWEEYTHKVALLLVELFQGVKNG